MTQDDKREKQLIELFQLQEPVPKQRGGLDAYLDWQGQRIEFEIKSCTNKQGTVSTARDVGGDHIIRWRKLHWLFGFYRNDKLVRCVYAAPAQISVWTASLEEYIHPDLELCKLMKSATEHIRKEDLYRIVGRKEVYGLNDARRIHKRSVTAAKYEELADLSDGYSANRMLEMLTMRVEYILARGATLNNPHIGPNFFKGLPTATSNYAVQLRGWLKKWSRGQLPIVRSATNTVELGEEEASGAE